MKEILAAAAAFVFSARLAPLCVFRSLRLRVFFRAHFLFDNRQVIENRYQHAAEKDHEEYALNKFQRRKARNILPLPGYKKKLISQMATWYCRTTIALRAALSGSPLSVAGFRTNTGRSW